MRQILKSCYYGIINFLPSFLLGLGIYLLLSTLAFIVSNNAVLHVDYYEKMLLWNKILGPINDNVYLFLGFIGILLIVSYTFFYATFLKIINPSLSIQNLQSKKLYFKILFYFIIGVNFVLILNFCSRLF